MKKYLKNTWYMYVIVFVCCFMLFLYEPLMLYLGNVQDFWFSISIMFRITAPFFLLCFIGAAFVFNIIYFLNKKEDKKLFKTFVMISFVAFICTYVQGNFLAGNLPLLDGTKIEWSSYKLDWIISIVLWVVATIVAVLLVKKLTLNKMVKYSGFVSLGVLVMLSLSLATSFLTCSESVNKEYTPLTTFQNYNKYSDDKNFIIFLLDAVDSTAYYDRLKADDEFKTMLSDFTYFPDTLSGHTCTAESIPLILTGKFYHNEETIGKWSTKAYKESYLFDLLAKNNYEINIYERDLYYDDPSVTKVANVYNINDDIYKVIIKKNFIKQELKYTMFKYLPAFLKRFSRIERMDFSTTQVINRYRTLKTENKGGIDNQFFRTSNVDNYKIYKKNKIEKVGDKIFKFIHLNGSHTPYELDKDFNFIENGGTYTNAIDNALTLTKTYLKMLKSNNIYDNSIIIIMADHGFESKEYGKGRQNPILFAKGFNEKHGDMKISKKPIHLADLGSLYTDLINGKKSVDAFSKIPDKRTRQFLYYMFESKDTMIEYETKDKAWELDKMYKTGKVFSRK